MKIAFVGDVHGRWHDLYRVLDEIKDADMVIQVGDFGWWPSYLGKLSLSRQLYWIDGNHEHFTDLKSKVNFELPVPQECHPNLFYIPRTTVMTLDGLKIGFMGGGCSIDRVARAEGIDYFREELPSYAEYMRLMAHESVDVMVTHDAPVDDPGGKNDSQAVGNRRALHRVKETLKPSLWLHGHYHHAYQHDGMIGLADCSKEGCYYILDTCK